MLATPDGQAVLKGVPNFATGGFTLLHDDEEVLIPRISHPPAR